VIVTPGTTTDCAVTATSGVEGAFGTTGFLVSTLATADARTSAGPEVRVASMPATSVSGGGGPAVMSAAAPTTQIIPRTIAGPLIARRAPGACFAAAAFFD
jgi:hypothetical protein